MTPAELAALTMPSALAAQAAAADSAWRLDADPDFKDLLDAPTVRDQ
jgi:hypothetical protein